ncbi:MAG: D-alanyl-D-alanine carboxypeptidase family protein [Campylobacterales bacterium]|nr:D-alanyl-D-alanine carboxypeptidase family protein [Campylobacterales bacterium]
MNRRTFLLLSALSPVLAKDYVVYNTDTYLNNNDLHTLKILDKRLTRVRQYVGFANFNTIGMDDVFFYGRNYPKIGEFSHDEIALIEKLFFSNPTQFGFYGKQTVQSITNQISDKDIIKIPYSGHYVFGGKPYDDYQRIIKDVGSSLILTSGIRNVAKQLSLYVSKILDFQGNISQASTIIAPPAYTYHAIKDFDVGKKGWGSRNFTSDFAKTPEFGRIKQLDYVAIRYTVNNRDGVRYEPWHVKVI